MKKLILLVLTFIVALSSISLANCIGNISQVGNASCITEYSDDTDIEEMDTVTFGSYPQSSSNSKEPIEWIVLEKQGDKALLLSKYILDYKNYNGEDVNTTWESCSLRKWLNNTFYNTAFKTNEINLIINSYILNNNNNLYETVGGSNTSDYIFLLSIDECKKYFGNEDGDGYNKRLATKGTNYATTVHNDGNDFELHVADANEWFDGNSSFWLRSSGNAQDTAAYACDNGYVELYGALIDEYDGIRPAIWVSLSASSNLQGGLTATNDGSDPFHAVEAPSLNMASSKISREAYEQLPDEIKAGVKKENIIDSNTSNTNAANNSSDGWHGDYYYTSGKMLKNARTPDGYLVDNYGKKVPNSQIIAINKNLQTQIAETDTYLENQIKRSQTAYNKPELGSVQFGNYKLTTSDVSEPIEWIVLDKQNGKALLMSKYVLFDKEFESVRKLAATEDDMDPQGTNWEVSSLRKWLNNDFYNEVFSNNEKNSVLMTKNENRIGYGVAGDFNPTDDKLFILDIVEATYYSELDAEEKIEKARSGEGYFYLPSVLRNNHYILCKNSCDKEHLLWTRSMGDKVKNLHNNCQSVVRVSPFSPNITHSPAHAKLGVRPAMWVKYDGPVSSITIPDVGVNSTGNAKSISNNVKETTKPVPKNGWVGDYYYQNDVPAKNTWVDYGSDKYYCGSTGTILKNQWIDNTYYVDSTGKMLKNTTTPDGYKVGADGKYIEEIKPQETKTQETKVSETKPQETKIANTTTNSSNKLTPLSEEELNDLAKTSLFSLTINNKYVDFIKIDSMNDGFLGLFGNKKYYVRLGYKLKLPEEELVTDYGNKYNNIDGNVIDCLGNKIRKFNYWIPSYAIFTNTKQDAENIKKYIESGNDYTAYFFDAMIESTGKYKADPKSAIFKVPFTSEMVKYARPSKTPNIKLEQDDDGVELIDGYGMSVKIGKDISEVRIEFDKKIIGEDLAEKIMNYDLGHQEIGANIIDNYGHKILKFFYSSFGTYAIYAENYQEAEEIASELNNNDCDYTLYFYDNVKKSTGKYKVDKSKALFNAALTADMIKNAVYTKTKDMKVVTAENGLQIMEGLNVSVDVGDNVYEIRIDLAKNYKQDFKEKIANYHHGHQDIGTNIIDNYGHKIVRFFDSSFGSYAIHAETEEEAKEITSVLNSSNCNYVLYFFDNVIASTGKHKVDTGSAKFNIKFTKDMLKYATAKQDIERTVVKDAEGFELMDGLAVSVKEGNDLFEVRIFMDKNLSESNKNKITTYDVAHFEGYGKDEVKTNIYDNYGHKINRFYYSSFGTYMINAEDLDQAKEISSVLNSSTCDYTLYFFD